MSMDFSGSAGAATSFDLIPNGQLAWAILTVRAVKKSQSSNGSYLDCELVLCDNQPFGRRKIFDKIGNPVDPNNGDTYRQMGMVAVTRILETGRGASDQNPGAYVVADTQTYADINGVMVAVKIGVEKGTDGYQDKNKVAEYLTPNPKGNTGGYKGYVALTEGRYNLSPPSAPAPVAQGSFAGLGGPQGGPQMPQQAAQPLQQQPGTYGPPPPVQAPQQPVQQPQQQWGVQPGGQPGFQQPQGNPAMNGSGTPAAAGYAPSATAPASPSDPANPSTPSWVIQAGMGAPQQ